MGCGPDVAKGDVVQSGNEMDHLDIEMNQLTHRKVFKLNLVVRLKSGPLK